MALLGLLSGPIGKWIGYAALAVTMAGAAWWVVGEHDSAVRGALLAEQRAAQLVQLQAQHERTVAALESEAASERARADAMATARRMIANAPITTACADSPAVRAALDGLRSKPSAAPGAPGGAKQPAGVPGAAGAAGAVKW